MSEADKLFEDLGYIKQYQNENGALYDKEILKIEFGKRYVMLAKKTKYRAVILNGEELKAINKKCEELRLGGIAWIV